MKTESLPHHLAAYQEVGENIVYEYDFDTDHNILQDDSRKIEPSG